MIRTLASLPVGDPEELIYVRELLKLDKNFKMVIFAMDIGDDNRLKPEAFEESAYEINGLADYSKGFIFDRSIIQVLSGIKETWGVPIAYQFNIDLNIGKLINTFINKNRAIKNGEQQVIDYLLKDGAHIPINVMSYIQERKTHKQNIKDKSLYQILLSIAQFEEMRRRGLKEIPNPSECYSIADKWWDVVCEDNDELQQVLSLKYLILYSFLLKVVSLQIKYRKKNEFEIKKNQLVEFINSQLFLYPENEFWYALKLFSGEKFAEKIFKKFSPNKTSKENIKNIKNMAWDLFHIRMTETLLEQDTLLHNAVVLPAFITEDKELNNYIKFNPIEKIIFFKDKMFMVREKNALEELTEKEFFVLNNEEIKRKKRQKNLSIDYLKKLSQKLERDLVKICD